MIRKVLFSVFALIIAATQNSYAAVKVTPTLLELNANKANGNYITTSFNVQGDKNEIIRFKVYPEYFKITQEGRMETYENKEFPDSLVKYARFVPNEFTLQNGRVQKVRLTVANLKAMPDGESRMVLFLEDVAAKEVNLPYANKDVTTKLIVKTRVGIPVYVDKGHFVKCAQMQDFKVEKKNKELIADLKLFAEGNSKVRYTGKAQIIRNKKLIEEYPLKNNVIGAKTNLFSTENIPLDKITENGDYTLRMILTYEDEKGRNKNIIKETMFTIDNVDTTQNT